MPEWTVSLPERLDQFLASSGRMLSRAKAQKAVEEGYVTVNDEIARKPSQKLQEGDHVRMTESALDRTQSSAIEPQDLHLLILYEDDACFVIDKPAGYAVHPGAGTLDEPTILHGIAWLFRTRELPFSPDAVLVHRLDKGTTGCLLIAKTPEAHLFLQSQFETRTVEKNYLALVAGVPKDAAAVIDAPIGRSAQNRTKMAITGATGSREAKTTYHTIAATTHASLLSCEIHTGRTHQIRVHLSGIGHPILGDETYTNVLSERLTQEIAIRTICLHAWKLTFTSPIDSKKHAVIAPLPSSFLKVLERLGIASNL